MSTKIHPKRVLVDKKVHEKSPFDNVHEKSSILKKSVHTFRYYVNSLRNILTIFEFQSISKTGGFKSNSPSISITPVGAGRGASPQQRAPQRGGAPGPMGGGLKPGAPAAKGSKDNFVICEICDGYIRDLEQLRNHMQFIHKVKIHPKMIHNSLLLEQNYYTTDCRVAGMTAAASPNHGKPDCAEQVASFLSKAGQGDSAEGSIPAGKFPRLWTCAEDTCPSRPPSRILEEVRQWGRPGFDGG